MPWKTICCLFCAWILESGASDFLVGAASVDITPDQPVALDGQRNVRISKKPLTPISATALVVESPDGVANGGKDHLVLVSCDLVAIRQGITQQVRDKVVKKSPAGLNPKKIILCATHTHTAPVTVEGRYALPEEGIMQPAAYAEWMTERIAAAVVDAWLKRKPGKLAWGQSQAVIARNRRPFYANGTAVMYGNPNSAEFRGIEGYEDHSVDVLYFWDATDKLIATAINVPCPAQEVGGMTSIHADFWHPVRSKLKEKHGSQLCILGLTGAGGDVTPRLAYGRAADERMRKLRGNVSTLDILAGRIVAAWEEALQGAHHDVRTDSIIRHTVQDIELPYRQITILERAAAMTEAASFKDDPKQRWNYLWNQRVVDRFEAQKSGKLEPFVMELHAVRIGDIAIATNEFELYTDYGVQMKARSPSIQTFIIQLTGSAGYLPTERAKSHGGYGAVIQSGPIGPEGGQALVERTVDSLKALW
jgi:hypothetical protein